MGEISELMGRSITWPSSGLNVNKSRFHGSIIKIYENLWSLVIIYLLTNLFSDSGLRFLSPLSFSNVP